MSIRSLFIAVVTLSGFALAQHKSAQATAAANAPDTTTCAATFSSGSGHNATSYCVTVNGNIVEFNRGGDEYIRVLVTSKATVFVI